MSDKLKKFIQRSKSKFDLESPRPDLFDKIMEKVDHQKIDDKPKQALTPRFIWIAVAATIALFIICKWYFNTIETPVLNPGIQIAEKPNEQVQQNIPKENLFEPRQTVMTEKIHENDFISNSAHTQKTKRKLLGRIRNPVKENLHHDISAPTIANEVAETPIQELEEAITLNNPLNRISKDSETISQTKLESEPTIKPVNPNSSMPEEANPVNVIATIEDKKQVTIEDKSDKETMAEEDVEASSTNLSSSIRKGFFKFLSKKAKKWSGNTLTIKKIETEEYPILAIHFKNERFEISKEFKLGNF